MGVPRLAAMSRRYRCVSVVVVLLALIAVPSARASARSRAARRVPIGFVGTDVGTPLYPSSVASVDIAAQLRLMVASGVETIRVPFDWGSAQPYEYWTEVPPAKAHQFVDVDGLPTDFGPMDQLVDLAARYRLTVLPTVLDAPTWDSVGYQGAVDIPKSPYWYAQFMQALVQRYGPNGSFWSDHSPKVPIRMWQIWNEVNLSAFWPQHPSFAHTYVQLLQAASQAIKAADTGATVVLAGLPNYSWVNLAQIYKVPGARSAFDVVAVHPYTRQPRGVLTILNRIRGVMDRSGDRRKPIVADEISWPSSKGHTHITYRLDIGTTEAGQARDVSQAVSLLANNRVRLGLLGFYWFTWATYDRPDYPLFDFSGLVKYASGRFAAKPALSALRRTALPVEGCARKGSVATACA